jgi:glycine/D-amino acid oxidase-like deaminating enzyme
MYYLTLVVGSEPRLSFAICLSLRYHSFFNKPSKMIKSEYYDTIVIGGGLIGSSAAWQLANAGERILLIEKQPEKYSHGSSFGEARITRSLGPQGDIFSWLHNRSVEETQKLAAFLEDHSRPANSVMKEIYNTSPVTYFYYRSQKEIADKLIINQTDPIDVAMTPEEAAQTFGMNVPDDVIVIREYKKYSGTLNPAMLIIKMQEAVMECGNEVRLYSRVQHLRKTDMLFEVTLEDLKTGKISVLTAGKVITAAGPYTGRLLRHLSPGIQKQITPERVCLSFFKISKEIWHRLSPKQQSKVMNSFPMIDMNEDFIFSMIENWDTDGTPVIKTGGHLRREPIEDLDNVWGKKLSKGEIDWAHRVTLHYFKMLNIPVKHDHLVFKNGYSCVYSMTDSEIPIVSEVLATNNSKIAGLVVMGGMSGIGAKGSLAYGLIAANLLLNRSENDPMYNKTVNALRLKV